MPFLNHLLRVRTLINSFLALGVFFILGTATTFAAAGDFDLSGGDGVSDGSLPDVGAASEIVNTIIIGSNGGDDISDVENFSVIINTTDYPSIIFDTSVTSITISGSFGATATNGVVTYNGAKTEATFTLATGGGDDGPGDAVTIAGLKVSSTYAMSATTDKALIKVDANTSSNGSVRTSVSTISKAVAVGTLSGTSVTPTSTSVGASETTTIAFTTGVTIPAQGKIIITFPSGYDLSAFGTSQTPTNATGITAANWSATSSGQVVTMTENNTGETAAGAISFKLANVRNPSSTGSTGTYTINTTLSAGNEIQKDTAVTASTIVGTTSSFTVGIPEGLTVVNQNGAVVLTWTDPDDDTTDIQILKGTDPLPVDGSAYATIPVGTQTYTDTDVEEGDVVTYQLRAYGSGRSSAPTEEVSLTVSFDEVDQNDSSSDSTTEDSTTEDSTTEDGTDTSSAETDDSSEDMIAPEEPLFSDISSHWAASVVEFMAEAGVVEGNPDGTFDPNGKLNRASAAALVWRVLGNGDAPAEINADPFQDVNLSAWYAPYVADLKALGLVAGNPDETYQPSEEINRAEFLKLALNVYLYLNPDMVGSAQQIMDSGTTSAYADIDSALWYAETVTVATQWNFVEGSSCDEDTCFNAGDSITRAEATKILYNMFADMLKEEYPME